MGPGNLLSDDATHFALIVNAVCGPQLRQFFDRIPQAILARADTDPGTDTALSLVSQLSQKIWQQRPLAIGVDWIDVLPAGPFTFSPRTLSVRQLLVIATERRPSRSASHWSLLRNAIGEPLAHEYMTG